MVTTRAAMRSSKLQRRWWVDAAAVASQIGRVTAICGSWSVLKYVEELDFGPDSPVNILFILGMMSHMDDDFAGNWSQCVVISGGEKIQIGVKNWKQFLHRHGSAVLDITSGGNMKDYFQTTYKFLELSPNVLIPMHGRINLWPERMLCGYLKHRRDREETILKAIENGAETVYDIVSKVYANADIKFGLQLHQM